MRNGEMKRSKPVERRHELRVPVDLLVERHERGVVFFDSAADMGPGGIFVVRVHDMPLPPTLDLSIHLPDGEPPVRTDAYVVHRFAGHGMHRGYGLQFGSRLSQSDATRLRTFVRSRSAA